MSLKVSSVGNDLPLDVKPLHKIFPSMQMGSTYFKFLTPETQGFQMLRATKFAQNPRVHKELVPGFIAFMKGSNPIAL